ncbi:MAG TPA: MarC family protein [Bacteroidales bacterium]|jgi:multiple antibiotic resistance protein|nr:MarC family protein [Bacteroidales bacterium]MDI9553275.1 MarC family protein [Bacteroidota bacterium]MZP65184.1 MarC family protein [Bacteroidales bacterium]NLK55105.1 MarC family protein [Bacteroidales bacterium]HNY52109.1 MarC family protein [Bacteroidales bacterium]
MGFDLREILAAFMVLFAIIDITGSIPIILDIKARVGVVHPMRVTIVSFLILCAFLFIGTPLLGIFGVDIYSFAIAGSFIIFLIAMEMILGIELFKQDAHGSGSVFPIAFPLIAGAGSITTILSIKAEYSTINIFIALVLNMVVIYFVLRLTSLFERILGKSGVSILKKVFGVILLSIAIKLFLSNTGITLINDR